MRDKQNELGVHYTNFVYDTQKIALVRLFSFTSILSKINKVVIRALRIAYCYIKLNSGLLLMHPHNHVPQTIHHCRTCVTLFIIGLLIRIIQTQSRCSALHPAICIRKANHPSQKKKEIQFRFNYTIYLFDVFNARSTLTLCVARPGTLDYPLCCMLNTKCIPCNNIPGGAVDPEQSIIIIWCSCERCRTIFSTHRVRDTISNFCTNAQTNLRPKEKRQTKCL